MTDVIENLIEESHMFWKRMFNVLSVRKATKFVDGKDTGVVCITFYVLKKQDQGREIQQIPKYLGNIPTDVVQLSPDDYELGRTSVSDLSPGEQKRMASGVKRK